MNRPPTVSPHLSEAKKPKKPYPDFPLFPHATKRWAKKIRGKLHYFGHWGDPEGALQKYVDQRDDLHAGRMPRQLSGAALVRDVLNHFLTAKRHLVDTREITPRTWADYYATCARLKDAFGDTRPVDDLRGDDFAAYRSAISKKWGPVALGNVVRELASVPMHTDEAGNRRPCFIRLDTEAKAEWSNWWNGHAQEMNAEDFPVTLRGLWAKMRRHLPRLVLVIHELRRACGHDAELVDAETVRHGIKLVDYFKCHNERALRRMAGEFGFLGDGALAIIGWLKRNELESFTLRELKSDLRRRFTEETQIDAAIEALEGAGVIREKPKLPQRRGRKSEAYEVNPSLLGAHAEYAKNTN